MGSGEGPGMGRSEINTLETRGSMQENRVWPLTESLSDTENSTFPKELLGLVGQFSL